MIQSATAMKPSELSNMIGDSSLHVAIIMDGGGRWAERRGWPRLAGHRAGAEAVRRVVRAAPQADIGTLTLFAFSSANWQRPASEAAGLMDIFRGYLETEMIEHRSRGVRLGVIGRRDRLPATLVKAIERSEAATAGGEALHLRLAIDYSARQALAEAAARQRAGLGPRARGSLDDFARTLAEVIHDTAPAPDVDLIIRTGGEQRVSDCLLWEGAFAEIIFTSTLWPDFGAADLAAAVEEFGGRERRFGGTLQSAAS